MNTPSPYPHSPISPLLLVSLLFVFLLLAACAGEPTAAPTPTLSPIEATGQVVFNLHCATCHSTSPDVIIVGPSLVGIASRAGERVPGMDSATYLQTSILKPDAYLVEGYPNSMLPDIAKQLTGEEFDAVVAYLLTMK